MCTRTCLSMPVSAITGIARCVESPSPSNHTPPERLQTGEKRPWSFEVGHSSRLAIAFVVIISTGCSVGPNYKRPAITPPESFRGVLGPVATNSLAELPWWEVFKDDALQTLIRTALTNNYDLRIAISRVEQARAIAAQNRAEFFPQLDYQASAGRRRSWRSGVPFANGGRTANSFVGAGNVSWEIDIWGRIRRLNEAARAQYLATGEARRAVMISVISEVAQVYFQLLALDRQLEIAKRSTNTFGESWRIFSERLEGGIVSKLETSAAEAALASAAATVPDFERQIIFQENQLSVLLGQNPRPIIR